MGKIDPSWLGPLFPDKTSYLRKETSKNFQATFIEGLILVVFLNITNLLVFIPFGANLSQKYCEGLAFFLFDHETLEIDIIFKFLMTQQIHIL